MPTYEYKCNKCEEVFEVFQKITDEPLKECPVCGGEVKRLVSGGAGIIFKGSGFYTTDYKRSSALSGPPSSNSGNGSSKSGESRPENKSTSSDSKSTSGQSSGD